MTNYASVQRACQPPTPHIHTKKRRRGQTEPEKCSGTAQKTPISTPTMAHDWVTGPRKKEEVCGACCCSSHSHPKGIALSTRHMSNVSEWRQWAQGGRAREVGGGLV